MTQMKKKISDILPVLPVRDSVIFPRMIIPLMIKDKKYIQLVDDALQKDKMIVVAMIKDPEKEPEEPEDIHRVGTAGQVVHRQQLGVRRSLAGGA